jgi:hypothetical protein
VHPFFPRTPDVRLHASATGMWQAAPDHLPITLQAPPPHADFRKRRLLEPGTTIDHSFEGWGGQAEVVWPDRRLAVAIAADTSRYVLYTPAEHDFFCFEPVDHTINAHNLPGQLQDPDPSRHRPEPAARLPIHRDIVLTHDGFSHVFPAAPRWQGRPGDGRHAGHRRGYRQAVRAARRARDRQRAGA